MKFENRSLLEGVGVIAVVLSLLFVAFQIQQANRIAIATTEIEVSNNYTELNEFIMENPEFWDLYYKAREPGVELTIVERSIYSNWARRLFNIWRGIDTAYRNGMVPEETYSIIEDDARLELGEGSSELVRDIWTETLGYYPGLADTNVFKIIYKILDEFYRAEK